MAKSESLKQFSTFYISDRLYGIDVMKVQEVTNALSMTRVPLAPMYVKGLINLRGQISTAICLRVMFKITEELGNEQMNVVCRINDLLVSFLVDQIGDVLELSEESFEPSPDTIPVEIRRFIKGVYKIPGTLLSVIDVDQVAEAIIKAGSKNLNTPTI
jgi:purine-binding chemotaxis protein CheW